MWSLQHYPALTTSSTDRYVTYIHLRHIATRSDSTGNDTEPQSAPCWTLAVRGSIPPITWRCRLMLTTHHRNMYSRECLLIVHSHLKWHKHSSDKLTCVHNSVFTERTYLIGLLKSKTTWQLAPNIKPRTAPPFIVLVWRHTVLVRESKTEVLFLGQDKCSSLPSVACWVGAVNHFLELSTRNVGWPPSHSPSRQSMPSWHAKLIRIFQQDPANRTVCPDNATSKET
jgi:hypothetical protein